MSGCPTLKSFLVELQPLKGIHQSIQLTVMCSCTTFRAPEHGVCQ